MSFPIVQQTREWITQVASDRPVKEWARRDPVWLDRAQVVKKFRWSADDFERAQAFSFPASCKRTPHPGSITVELVWREDLLDEWAQALRVKVETIKRLVGGST